jgi:hypothetical protein
MLVYHVDYNRASWTSNRVNTALNHQRLTIIPASGTLFGANNSKSREEWQTSLQGNPYPGITENHELTDYSEPASLVFTGSYMGKPLVDIQETTDGIITVKAMPLGTLDAPTGLAFQDTQPGSTTAIWDSVEGAELYNLTLCREGEPVLRQDSIAGTSFRLTDMQPDVDYTYSVQAISNSYCNSEWTESESFRPNPDAISDIAESTERVRIYDMRGRLAGECFADELNRIPFTHGIYIVRRSDGTAKKLMIRQ